MSLQPRWAEAILNGEKTIELRRNRAGCEKGTPVVIYNSYPVREIQGRCQVEEVTSGPVQEMWERVKEDCGCTREEYESYFEGADTAYAIRLRDVQRIDPVSLPFHGPQSYRYLFADEEPQAQVLRAVNLID